MYWGGFQMYINNQKRKLDPRDLDTICNADYFTCIYYKPQGKRIREEHKTYKKAYISAKAMTLPPIKFDHFFVDTNISEPIFQTEWHQKERWICRLLFYQSRYSFPV